MKRLLATAIALSTLGALPVQAGSVWLILVLRNMGGGSSMEKIEMNDLEQCNEQGALYMANQAIQAHYREGREFVCVEGK